MIIKKEFFVSIIFLLFVLVFTAFAGQIDSLKSKLDTVSGKGKIEILNQLAGAYWELPPNDRITFAEQSVDLSEKFHNQKSKAVAFGHLGVAYNNTGNTQKSMDYFMKSLDIMEQLNDKDGIAHSCVNIGQANFYMDNFVKALEYFQKALEIRNIIGNKMDISQSFIHLGNVKSMTEKFDEALDYYFKALKIKEKINDKMGLSQIYNNLGNVYLATDEMGKVLEYRLKSLQIDRELDDKWEIALTTYNIAEYYLENKEPDKAYPYLIESQELAKKLENKGLIRDNTHFLSWYYELKNNYPKALKYQKDYAKLTKEQFSETLSEKIAEMQVKYETEKKAKENQTYKFRLEKARTVRLRLIIGLLIILLIAFVFYYRYRVKKKAALILEDLVAKRTNELQENIADLKKTEKNLQVSEEKYRSLVENIEEGIGNVDGKENFTYVNQANAKIFGYSKDEMIGKNLKEFTTPASFQKVLKETVVRKKGVSGRYELNIFRKNGEQRIITINATPIISKNGKFKGASGIFHDITERKRAIEALRESEEKHRTLIETTLEGFGLIDPENRIIDANRSLCDMLGYSKNDIIGKTLFDFVDDESSKIFKEQISQIISTKHRTYEISLKKKDDHNFPIFFNATSLVDKNGNPAGFFAFITDITERKKAEQELRKYREHLEELVKERTKKLDEKNKELEHFNNLFINREFRIKELKDKVKELEKELGEIK